MKKLVLAISILCSLTATAQSLDTMQVRNLALRGRHIVYLLGKDVIGRDSAAHSFVRRLGAQIRATPNVTLNTIITIDSIPAQYAWSWYQVIKSSPAGEVEPYFDETVNSFHTHTELAFLYGTLTGAQTADRNRFINLGKSWVLDSQ